MIPQADLTRWRELCERATPGPWEAALYATGDLLSGKRCYDIRQSDNEMGTLGEFWAWLEPDAPPAALKETK